MHRWIVGLLLLTISTTLVSSSSGFDEPPAAPTDAEISKHLVGKWAVDEVGEQKLKVKGTAHYKKDGTFEGAATIGNGESPAKIAISGTWKVADGVITSTVTKSSLSVVIAQGRVYKDQVLAIDEKAIKYKTEAGTDRVRLRLAE